MITTGICRHCGQVIAVEACSTQEEADEMATASCTCLAAGLDRDKRAELEDAWDSIEDLFGANCRDACDAFRPVDEYMLQWLKNSARMVQSAVIGSVAVTLNGGGTAKLNRTSKGEIRVTRTKSQSVTL